jgi:archaellin
VVVAEGAHYSAISLADYLQQHSKRLGAATTRSVADGQFGVLMGFFKAR